MKYVTKVEVASKVFHKVTKATIHNADPNSDVVKVLQSSLIKSQTRDVSKYEASLLISNEHNYTESSMAFKMVSVSGTKKINLEMVQEGQTVGGRMSSADVYWSRDKDPNYQAACKAYEEDKDLFIKNLSPHYKNPPHPKDCSLHFFVSMYSNSWKPKKEVVALISPCFMNVPNKLRSRESFELYCKSTLLEWKPGANPDNLGQDFESIEEELADFVKNSEFCPSFVKTDFEKSQKCVVDKTAEDAVGQVEEKELQEAIQQVEQEEGEEGDSSDPTDFPPLFIPPGEEDDEDNVLNRELIALHKDKLKPPTDKEIEQAIEAQDTHETGAKQKDVDYNCPKYLDQFKDYNWQEAYEELGFDEEKLKDAQNWLNGTGPDNPGIRRLYKLPPVDFGEIKPEDLNEKQRMAFDLATDWSDSGMRTGKFDQLLLHISGKGGKQISCISFEVIFIKEFFLAIIFQELENRLW